MAKARAVVLVLLAGCRAATPTPTADHVEITRIVAEIEYLRQLPHKAPIVVSLVDEKTFRSAMARELVLDPDAAERERAWLTAFSMAPADVDLGGAAETHAAAIAAIYNSASKRLMVPKGRTFEDYAVAHEVGHALADQHFRFKDSFVDDDEAAAAYFAFVEGDAAVVQTMFVNRNILESPSTVLWNVARERGESERELVAENGPYRRYARWIPAYRDEILLRYSHGFRFIAALHRTGGFALVNRAWQRPPTTTEQILHPEKYLAGEARIPVASPAIPPGATSVMASSTGEMGIRSVLSMCVDESIAHAAASGWGGDAYRVVRLADGRLGLLWVTAWDDEPAAVRFAATMNELKPCWDSALLRDAQSKHARLAGGTTVLRDGHRVAVLRGVDAAYAAAALAGVGVAESAVPPLGPIKLVPFPAEDAPAPRGRLVGGKYDLSEFGFALELPEEMTATTSDVPGVVLTGPGNNAYFEAVVIASDKEGEVITRFRKNLADVGAANEALVQDAGRGSVETPLGVADERRFIRGPLSIRMLFVPICGGLRKVALLSWWYGEQNAAYFDVAIAGLSRVGAEPPPACR